ncbi:MAG: recombinase family protein [Bacteroidota bacterium]|nr:recombinase family protein [Bacteroidota bacterium]
MSTKKKNKKPIVLPENLGIYVRVSTEKQAEFGISIQDQIKRGTEVAKNLNWKFEIFEDAGISGMKNVRDRPGLNSLVDKINLYEIGGIYITDIDRLTREVTNGSQLLTFLKDNNVRIFSVRGEINLKDDTDLFQSNLSIVFANFERNKMASRISRALERNALDGKVSGGPFQPYGYKKDRDKMLVIDEKEAEVVKLIYSMSLEENKGTKIIAFELNEKNIPTKRGNSPKSQMMVRGEKKTTFKWRDAVIYNILTNPIYKGERHYKEHILKAPAIVSEEYFDMVQRNLSEKNKFKNIKGGYFFLLKGLVRCGNSECKGTFYGRQRVDLKDHQYTCVSQRYKAEWCGNRGINIKTLDDLIWDLVLSLPQQVEQFFNRLIKTESYKLSYAKAAQARDKEKDSNEKMDKLIDIADMIPKDKFKERMDKYQADLESARKDKLKYLKEAHLPDEKGNILKFVNDFLSPTKAEGITNIEKQKIVRAFIDCIYVTWNPETSRHWIMVDYKIDALSQAKLSRNIEIEYEKRGWRFDKKGFIKNSLEIRQLWGNDLFEGLNPSRSFLTNVS